MARTSLTSDQSRRAATQSGYTLTTVNNWLTTFKGSFALDVYKPTNPGQIVVLAIHGGGWLDAGVGGVLGQNRNSNSAWVGMVRYLAERGFCVINPDYTCIPVANGNQDARYRQQMITDFLSAVTWARANAATYNGDASRIVVFGASSAGQLGLMSAIQGTKGTTRADAYMIWSPVTRLDLVDFGNYLAVSDSTAPQNATIAQQFSPYNQMTTNIQVPLRLTGMTGATNDPAGIRVLDWSDMQTKAVSVGVDSTLVLVPVNIHADFRGYDMDQSIAWIYNKLGPVTTDTRSTSGTRSVINKQRTVIS